MITEGLGMMPPAPKKVPLSEGDLRVAYLESIKRAEHRGYSAMPTKWQKGLLDESLEISGVGRVLRGVRPIFAGTIAEIAVGRIIGSPVDFSLRAKGDDGIDFVKHGLS